jgi:hypothetical protein
MSRNKAGLSPEANWGISIALSAVLLAALMVLVVVGIVSIAVGGLP